MVVDSGWNEKGRRIYDVVLHFRLQNGIIYIERDNTDAEVVREILESDIATGDIILAYNALPYQRLNDLIAT
jgi:methylase of polypeptide subunit release factors